MARQRFDIGSKWLLHNQGKSVLLVGGLKGVRASSRCRARSSKTASTPMASCECSFSASKSRVQILIERLQLTRRGRSGSSRRRMT